MRAQNKFGFTLNSSNSGLFGLPFGVEIPETNLVSLRTHLVYFVKHGVEAAKNTWINAIRNLIVNFPVSLALGLINNRGSLLGLTLVSQILRGLMLRL